MGLMTWSQAEREAFLLMQFNAQHSHYRQAHPRARYDIVQYRGESIGRFYVDDGESEGRIIDIALLAKHRGAGIGSALIRDLLVRADGADKCVSLHVERTNHARRLYLRLGFRTLGDDGVYLFMKRTKPNGITQ
jgi:ribosomal protein S18 acetylase RimI-like enzyme